MSQDERECSHFNFAICLPKDQLTLVTISCHALNKQFFPWLSDQESWKKNTYLNLVFWCLCVYYESTQWCPCCTAELIAPMMFTHQSKIALSLAGRLLATRMYLRIDLASLDLIVTFSNLSTSSGTAAVGERWWFTNDFAITGKQKTRTAEMWLRGKSVQVAVF